MSKWKRVRLGDIGVFRSGGTPTRSKPEYFLGNIPWITTISLGKMYIDERNAVEYISEEAIANSSTKIISRNSIMIGIRVGVGKVSINTVPMCTNQDIISIENIDENRFCKPFLVYCINIYRDYFEKNKRGATIQGINSEVLKSIKIPFPPLEIQKQIAKTLDTAAEMLAMRKRQLADLDNLTKSIFYDMFGDPVTNERGWEIKKLSEIGIINRGVSKHRPRNDPALLGGVHPLIQTGDVANADFIIRQYNQTYSDLGLQQSKMWSAGTLCITIAANIAKTAILGFDACFPDSVVGFNANEKTNNVFVFFWFGFFQKIIEAQAPESAQKNINLRILNNLEVIVPPIELQNQFAEIVTKIEEQKALVKKAIDETQYLFDSLMSEYFD